MNTIELNCPCCGANIHVDESLVAFDCPNCGNRIVLTEQMDTSTTRSASTGKETKQPNAPSKQKSPLRGVVAAILAVAVVGGAGFVGSKVYTVNQIENSKKSVWEYIDQKDFSRARSELGTLFESHWFYKEKWESAENVLSAEIDKKEQEYIDSIKRSAPMSKKEAVKGNVDDVTAAFRNAGFTNIIQKSITDPKQDKNAQDRGIKSISVKADGEEVDFKAGDALKTNAEIRITYYDFSASPAVPMSASEVKNKDKEEVRKAFEEAKFINIDYSVYVEPEPEQKQETSKIGEVIGNVAGAFESAKDTVTGLFTKEDNTGKVQSVSILDNGKEIVDFKKGERFPREARITITYYE